MTTIENKEGNKTYKIWGVEMKYFVFYYTYDEVEIGLTGKFRRFAKKGWCEELRRKVRCDMFVTLAVCEEDALEDFLADFGDLKGLEIIESGDMFEDEDRIWLNDRHPDKKGGITHSSSNIRFN